MKKLRTCSGETLYNREHKVTLSKTNSIFYADIDNLYINNYDDDEAIFKPKKKYNDMLDKIYKKINNIKDAKKNNYKNKG